MRCLAAIACSLLLVLCTAQWSVPVPLVLNGTTDADRQVTGLADPLTTDAAVSVNAARNNATTYAEATGTDVLLATLVPAPSAYSTGMVLHILPSNANSAQAQIDVNGLGARAILKQGGLALDSADLAPGVPVRMVYDGTAFLLLGNSYLPCKAGYTTVSRQSCIEDSSHAEISFYAAAQACASRGARLCTYSEWTFGCRAIPGFLGTVTNYEWIDHAANNTSDAKRIGYGSDGQSTISEFGCTNGGTAAPTTPARYRCCTNR
jgi:hypothetical protein